LDKFQSEIKESIRATHGHIDLISQDMAYQDPDASIEYFSKRITGFTKLIGIHMHRSERFLTMLERMEDIRVGRLPQRLEERYRKIDLKNYMEDFVEELDEIILVDPETPAHDHRSRLEIEIHEDIAIRASALYLTRILHDILGNAIMYSMVATPIKIAMTVKGKNAQIDIVDEGYGVRDSERERVLQPFSRARQPQIIAEFGYGLSLYLGKYEVEAMNGRMWYESNEGVGSTFSLMLPLWTDQSVSSSSQTSTA
jgi:K+-sensing histidine kinase KdpD